MLLYSCYEVSASHACLFGACGCVSGREGPETNEKEFCSYECRYMHARVLDGAEEPRRNLHPPRGGTVKLSELMAFHAAVDELFRSYRCRSVYLDVGSNIGVQIRKLYEPEKYPAAPALRIFDDVFGRDRCDVCTIGIEPNPHHTARLTDLERRYRATGLPVLVLIAAASDAESRTQLALEDRDHVNTAEDTGATTVASWQGARAYSSISVVDVRTLDLAALIYRVHRHLQELHGRERGTSRILMKLDVEGSEYSILPHLVLTQTLCLVDRAFLEWHPSNYAPSAVATAAARRHLIEREAGVAAVGTMMRAVNGAIHEILLGARNKFDCRLQSTFLDDEEYLWDGQPWPNTTICSTRAARTLLAATLIARTRRLAGTFLAGKLLAGTLLARKRVAGAHHADAADTTGTVDATGGAEMSFHRLFAWPSCTHGPATAM